STSRILIQHTAATDYYPLPLHDALPIFAAHGRETAPIVGMRGLSSPMTSPPDSFTPASRRLRSSASRSISHGRAANAAAKASARSEEHTSELQSHLNLV